MISRKFFHYEIGHDDRGLIVTVTHKLTGRRKIGYPSAEESISMVQERLHRELLFEFYNEKDFLMSIGRCSVNGRIGDLFQVVHVPTNRTKAMDSVTNPDVKHRHMELLDLLVEELWREELIVVAEQNNAPHQDADCER